MGAILEVKDLTKIYPGGVLANHQVNFSVEKGEIHALVGENGAGKSTLMKMLYGIESVTSGEIFVEGEKVEFSSSKDAIAMGIGMVHQHFMLVDSLTGAENMMLGMPKRKQFTNRKQEVEETENVAAEYNFEIDAAKKVRDMSVGMKQKLEILKALYRNAKILILDEPTAVLTPQETEELFERLKELKDKGMTIIFISHKLKEVKQICDRLTILKAGETHGTYEVAKVSEADISRLMVGKEISFEYEKTPIEVGKEILSVENLYYTDAFGVRRIQDLSMNVREGEILGIAGVDGNGQSELISIITSSLRSDSGKICFQGEDVTGMDIGKLRKRGLAYIPEDRMLDGCAPQMSVQENLLVSNIDTFTNGLRLIDKKKVDNHAHELIREFQVKTPSEKQTIKSLSGGNIQKAIIAREFTAKSSLLILNQPTRGVDIGAISFIHHKILEKREERESIILISADLSEIISLSDRIIVMHKGRVVAEFDNTKTKVTDKELGLYMLGIKTQNLNEKKPKEGERTYEEQETEG